MALGQNKNTSWYNNGIIEGMYVKPPEGWTKGRLVKGKKEQKLDIAEKVRKANFTRPQRRS